MISVTPGTGICLSSLSEPEHAISATLVSQQGKIAEIDLEGANPLAPGALVQFHTPDALYLGEVESELQENRLRILIDHSIDLARARSIRRLWNTT